jgi:hypothetical protein
MVHWKHIEMPNNFLSREYPEIANKPLEIVFQLSMPCLQEMGFSALRNIKHKKGNTLIVLYIRQMWVCLSNIPLKFVKDTELK